MKTATVRQLRHAFPTVLQWIEQGETVKISRRGRVVAVLSPPEPKKRPRKKVQMPDFAAQLREVFGDRVIPADVSRQIIEENRGRY